MTDVFEHNRMAWDRQSRSDVSRWCQPVAAATVAAARGGDWEVILTPNLPVPRAWFGELARADVLCLAAGGGQQAPILAAAGGRVVSFDASQAQLDKDAEMAQRERLDLRTVQGDMADLSAFYASFDLVVAPSVATRARRRRQASRPGAPRAVAAVRFRLHAQGQPLSEDDQWRKLELVVSTARRYWG